MDTLHLDISDYKDPDHWRFVLKSQDGAFLAEHAVALDRADAHYRGFIDLPYLDHYAADRDKRDEQERALVGELGAWIGEKVFGPIATKIVAQSSAAPTRPSPPPAALPRRRNEGSPGHCPSFPRKRESSRGRSEKKKSGSPPARG